MNPLIFTKKKDKKLIKRSKDIVKADKKRVKQVEIRSVSDARKWVDELPLTDMGEVSRRVYNGLSKLNNTALPPQVRIDIAEVVLPYIKMTLENLDRHFLSRSFPLPVRSQKIFELKKAILLEAAGSYQLAALDMLTKHSASKKSLLIAISRAIRYMSLVLINGYANYANIDKSIWHDIHHLFLLACENKLQHKVVPKKGDIYGEEVSIEDNYKLINLIALAVPNTLRPNEVAKISDFFKSCIDKVSLISNPDNVKSKYAHIALLNSDEPATLMPISDLVNSPTSRIFDLSKVIGIIDKFISDSEDTDLGTHHSWPMLTHTLAKRLNYVLTTIRNRRYKRFPREDKASMVIRLVDIIEIIRENDPETFFDEVNADIEEDNIYEALASEEGVSSPWASIDYEALAEEREVNIHTWTITNSSAGGYGLKQIKPEASPARVGELVAIKDPKDRTGAWQIAVVRWMNSFRNVGLQIGIELLSQHAMTIEINAIVNRKIPQKLPLEGVLLPTIDGARDEANIILPSFIFKSEDELLVTLGAREQTLTITSINDTVGNFSHISFETSDIQEEEDSDNSFEDIWEFL